MTQMPEVNMISKWDTSLSAIPFIKLTALHMHPTKSSLHLRLREMRDAPPFRYFEVIFDQIGMVSIGFRGLLASSESAKSSSLGPTLIVNNSSWATSLLGQNPMLTAVSVEQSHYVIVTHPIVISVFSSTPGIIRALPSLSEPILEEAYPGCCVV